MRNANQAEQNYIGAIDYRRGYIQVVDRKGLEAIACECYQEYDDLDADLSK